MKGFSIQEFKPTIFFLLKFVGIYLVGNLLYGIFITNFNPQPDPVTHLVARHTSTVLNVAGWKTEVVDHEHKPNTLLRYHDHNALAIYEGCNGINTMIIFVAFIIAFSSWRVSMLWFIPAGIAIIHLMNLLRIALLFVVSEYIPRYMYITHKYLFTAFLYAVIFGLWMVWLKKFSKP
ncbi:MAG: exosortase family protein XrtF [Cyclobacteriaceae bacterium]|nr:exosortase family protein XrtF [Cyclobacteriaceae bacterium]